MPAVVITLHDVEPAVRLNAHLEKDGVVTHLVSPLDDLRGIIERVKPEAVVFTGDLTDRFIESVVSEQLWAGVPSIGLADVHDERQLERLRAVGYVELFVKPVETAELAGAVRRMLERRRVQRETGLIGESEALREVLVKIEQMASVSSTVLIEGESGTGKELVARALHRLSARRTRPFIAVNVGALPDTLLESELFGHEKGAFTGAAERRIGRFELAHSGTLFLDEIGEIPPATQVKLLRVLEEREFVRVGGTAPIKVDVRVIAATNRPLRQHVEEGAFRSDLFYRLNVLSIGLPPLRERPEDIPHIVRRFVSDYVAEHGRPFSGISADAMKKLMEYPWPGNVRELRNLVESMVVLSHGREIVSDDLPRQIREGGTARFLPVHVGPIARAERAAREDGRELEFILRSLLELRLQVEELRHRLDGVPPALDEGAFIGEVLPDGQQGGALPRQRVAQRIAPREEPPPNTVLIQPGMTMNEIERRVIEATLRETRGSRRKAAKLLDIGERTLYRKIREYELPVSD